MVLEVGPFVMDVTMTIAMQYPILFKDILTLLKCVPFFEKIFI